MDNLFRRVAMCLTGSAIIVYLGYRAMWTLNLSGPLATLFSLVLFAAELYGAALLFLYFFNIWELSEPKLAAPLPERTVDVLIPTKNEDPNILRGTICAALAIEYPHQTYVLDDGRRPEVEKLCRELGATYISRANNLHAKAGNLNHALEQTGGEFIVFFDADQICTPNFITRLIGYFADERLAFVQTPHAFYNFDSFQARLNYKRASYWEDGELFYNLVQPGKNRWNAAMFCGSAAMFRRSALVDVGLIATETITEDMHTGLRLHAKGWKSLFVNERLISALAAPDVTAFLSQRLRWGEGNLGVFFYDNPITMRGLTLAQRLSYVGSILSWTTGFQKLILYSTPMVMLFTGVAPVNELTQSLVLLTVLYLAAIWIGVKIASQGHSRLIAEELIHMTCFWMQCRAMYRAVMKRQKAQFIVTSKRGRQSGKVWPYIAPQFLYIILAMAAVTWAATLYRFGIRHDKVSLTAGSLLVTVHALFAWAAVCRGLRRADRRYSWRHPCQAHVNYEVSTAAGDVSGQAVTQDLNERGASLIACQRLPLSELLWLTISAGGTTTGVYARIRQEQPISTGRAGMFGPATAYRYGVQFEDQTTAELAALWSIGGGYGVARQYERFNPHREGRGATAAGRGRSAFDAHLPITLDAADPLEGVDCSVTEWMDGERFACLLTRRLEDGAQRRFRMDTPFGPVQGDARVGFIAERVIEGRTLFNHRFEVRDFAGQSRGVVQSVLQTVDLPATRAAIAPIPGVQETPLLSTFVTSMVLGALVSVGIIVASMILFQNEITLKRVAEGESTAPRDVATLDRYADMAAAGEVTDRDMLSVILAGLYRVKHADKLNAIWESPAANSWMTTDERLSRAQIRAGAGRHAGAEEDFEWLLDRANEPAPGGLAAERLPELYLAAARNSYNAGDKRTAATRYGLAFRASPNDPQLAVEYAGVLITEDRDAEAIEVLKSLPHDDKGQRLLASAEVREGNHAAAIAIYRELLEQDPDNATLRRDLADVTAWSGDFESAAPLYAMLLEATPEDRKLKNQMARVWLGGHRYDEALEILRALLEEHPTDAKLQQEYLDAAAAAGRLTPSDRQMTRTLLDNSVADLPNRKPEYAARLADVLTRFHDFDRLIPVLQRLVESDPDNLPLRRRLADTLSNAGRFKDAEFHYRLLLARRHSDARSRVTRPTNTRRGNTLPGNTLPRSNRPGSSQSGSAQPRSTQPQRTAPPNVPSADAQPDNVGQVSVESGEPPSASALPGDALSK